MEGVHILTVEGVLVVTLPGVTDDRMAERLVEEVAGRLVEHRARAVVIDVSNARLIDSFMGRVLEQMARTARLMGVEPMLTGMRPEVAITLIELGMTLGGIATALSLEHGLARLRERAGGRS
ncbi:STAS domain-containing protein [Rhodospirillum centenum]|uniref:Antagonist protein RsbS n=1 Tax=Rhodospirillum centenum (strain ATCC 51521 / SW) TaxID=414684 RepID=B6IQQ6_RHOCS|nr:STAS domain-containing protein [Rhodospirillum centenum]ACI97792.1 antagonist protein RsbS [Rhodospirillum centenum SW]